MIILMRFIVSGHSMEPTFKLGKTLLVSSIPYLFQQPKVGDVVVVKDPRDGRLLLKRITKILSRHSGEPFDFAQGKLRDSRIKSGARFWTSPAAAGSRQRRGQNDKEYFVTGDNPKESTDSRSFGAININAILGKVLTRKEGES